MNYQAIAERIHETTGTRMGKAAAASVGGGCINNACVLTSEDGTEKFFVKTNTPAALDMFEAEEAALRAIAATKTVRVPEPLCSGVADSNAYLVLEYLPLASKSATSQRELGHQLAALHRCVSQDGRFGWHRDNTIGSTPQTNTPTDNWAEFFAEHRIGRQLELSAKNGHPFKDGAALVARIPSLLAGHEPIPSLLHGDLWGGNAAADTEGNPVVFDPATYYGDRETDLAFTEMFGGFSADFYRAYDEAFPPDLGREERKRLYNLYHVLNHHLLFGGGYTSQAAQIIRSFI